MSPSVLRATPLLRKPAKSERLHAWGIALAICRSPVQRQNFHLILTSAVQWCPEHRAGNSITTLKLNYCAWEICQNNLSVPTHSSVWSQRHEISGQVTGKNLECFKNSSSSVTCCGEDAIFFHKSCLSSPCLYSMHIMKVSSLCEWQGWQKKGERGEGAARAHLHFKRGAGEVLRAYSA